MATPCIVCRTPTANEVIVGGVRSALCSVTCRNKVLARSEPRELVADWVVFSANELGLAGRKSEMWRQGVRLEVLHNTEFVNRGEVFFLDDLRRDDVAALRAIVDMIRAARADTPVGPPPPAVPPPVVVLYPVESSNKLLSAVIMKLAEHS